MSKEYMQALYDLFGLVAFQKSLTKEQYARLQKYNDIIEQALERLESIDNANPSEALKGLDTIKNHLFGRFKIEDYSEDFIKDYEEMFFEPIKQALLKAQEQEKVLDDKLIFKNGSLMSGFEYKGKPIVAMPLEQYDDFMKQEKVLEIIKEKNVDFDTLTDSEALDDYNSKMNWSYRRLTQEEFDLLKRWLG